MKTYGKFSKEDKYFKQSSFGRNGFRLVKNNTTLPSNESYMVLYVAEDTQITAVTKKGDSLIDESFTAGSIIYGIFTDIQVTTGKVIAYIA